MKKSIFILGLVGLILLFTTLGFSEVAKLPTLAVVSFENHSAVDLPNLENMGLQFLESTLSQSGMFVLLDRRTIARSLTEINFTGASGLVDPNYAIKIGRMLGARYLAMGNVIDVTQRVISFKGYGISTKRTAVSVTIGLRVIDAERGIIFFVDQEIAAAQVPMALNVNSEESFSIYQTLMKKAILKAVDKFNKKAAILLPKAPKPHKKLTITVDSIPQGADVEIGGIFYGNTPCDLELEEGRIVEIKISMGGYEPWIKKVMVNPKLKIKARLAKAQAPQSTGSIKVETKVETKPATDANTTDENSSDN